MIATAAKANRVGVTSRRAFDVTGTVAVASVLRAEASPEWEHGVHWWWNGQTQVYTAAGVEIVARFLDADGLRDEAALLRDEMAGVAALAVQAEHLAAAEAAAAAPDFAAKRWDLREANA